MAYNTKKIALTGILGALAVISLLFAVILPTTKLSLYALSSFLISIIIIEYKIPAGWLFYITINILAYIVIPDKLGVVPYTFFFGLYGIVKYYAEKVNAIVFEYIIKYLFFNICLLLAFFLTKQFLPNVSDLKYPLWVAFLIMQFVFILYDYVYTMIINYYKTKLRKILKI